MKRHGFNAFAAPACFSQRKVLLSCALVSLIFASASAVNADEATDAARLKADIALYAEANACGEEPLADRLRAAVLLAEAGRGRSAQHILETRQAFLDGWRERARRPAPSTAACRTTIDDAQTRADALRR